jgi:hypothetical protein
MLRSLQAVVTIFTVGFGDVTPDSDAGKIFTIFYALFGCALNVNGFSQIVRYPMLLRAKKNEMYVYEQFEKGLSQRMLQAIIQNDLFDQIPKLRRGLEGEIRKVRQ